MSPFPALVTPSAEYLNYPPNQYARMGVPREGVCLMGGDLGVYLQVDPGAPVEGSGISVKDGVTANKI